MVSVGDVRGQVVERHQLRTFPCFSEDGMEVAFKERTGVFEVLLGVGLGGVEADKRFVQNADDPVLFEERGDWNFELR